MDLKNYISVKEFKLLLVIGFLASSFAFVSLTYKVIDNYNESVIKHQEKLLDDANGELSMELFGFTRGSFTPLFCFSTLFIFIALLKSKRFIFSSFLTFFCFSLFSYESFLNWRVILSDDRFIKYGFIKLLSFTGNAFDYLAFLSILILMIWQISIIFRFANKNFQAKIPLR